MDGTNYLTPFRRKSIDLHSLRDTFEMQLTEIEFENKFSDLFNTVDLPLPIPKTTTAFEYPVLKRKNTKRRAPAPPKPKVRKELNIYKLRNLQELGPILTKSSMVIPRTPFTQKNVAITVRLSMKSSKNERKTKLKTFAKTSSLSQGLKRKTNTSLDMNGNINPIIKSDVIDMADSLNEENSRIVLDEERPHNTSKDKEGFKNSSHSYDSPSNKEYGHPQHQNRLKITSPACGSHSGAYDGLTHTPNVKAVAGKRKSIIHITHSNPCVGVRPNFLQNSPKWMQNAFSEITGMRKDICTSTSLDSNVYKNGRLNNRQENDKEFSSYTRREHIYEEIDLCTPHNPQDQIKPRSSESSLLIKLSQPVQQTDDLIFNSPNLPSFYNINTNKKSGKRKPPQKPPRNQNKGTLSQSDNWLASQVPYMNHNMLNESSGSYIKQSISKENEQVQAIPITSISENYENHLSEAEHNIERYYFGESIPKTSNKQDKSIPQKFEKTPSRPALVLGLPGSRSATSKKQKKNKFKAFAIPKTFKFSLKTSSGNFKFTGKKYFSKSHKANPSKDQKNEDWQSSYLSVKPRDKSKSPTPISHNNFRIPRVIIDCEPASGDDYSPEVLKIQKAPKNIEAMHSSFFESPETQILRENSTGTRSPEQFYTPISLTNNQGQNETDEIEYIKSCKSDHHSNFLVPNNSPEKDIIYIKTVKTPFSLDSSLDSSIHSLHSSGVEDENSISSQAKISPLKKQHRTSPTNNSSINDFRLGPRYFRSSEDILDILDNKK